MLRKSVLSWRWCVDVAQRGENGATAIAWPRRVQNAQTETEVSVSVADTYSQEPTSGSDVRSRGIDAFLRPLARGGPGRPWNPCWRACSARLIRRALVATFFTGSGSTVRSAQLPTSLHVSVRRNFFRQPVIPFSVLDLAPIVVGGSAPEAAFQSGFHFRVARRLQPSVPPLA
jgi:hypothetical protein